MQIGAVLNLHLFSFFFDVAETKLPLFMQASFALSITGLKCLYSEYSNTMLKSRAAVLIIVIVPSCYLFKWFDSGLMICFPSILTLEFTMFSSLISPNILMLKWIFSNFSTRPSLYNFCVVQNFCMTRKRFGVVTEVAAIV